MNVYFCLSEELTDPGHPYGDPPEPPETGPICEIVRAESRGMAKWLAWKTDRHSFTGEIVDMPRFATRKLGVEEGTAAVLPFDTPWWSKVPESVGCPGAVA